MVRQSSSLDWFDVLQATAIGRARRVTCSISRAIMLRTQQLPPLLLPRSSLTVSANVFRACVPLHVTSKRLHDRSYALVAIAHAAASFKEPNPFSMLH